MYRREAGKLRRSARRLTRGGTRAMVAGITPVARAPVGRRVHSLSEPRMHPVAFTSPAPRRRPGARARGRIVRRLLLPICLAVLGTVSACARSSRTAATDEVPSEITQLRVQNQAFLDMNIYVLRGA